eukprot:scaffold145964_cov17-Tisochrysis_lutea.AAC.1
MALQSPNLRLVMVEAQHKSRLTTKTGAHGLPYGRPCVCLAADLAEWWSRPAADRGPLEPACIMAESSNGRGCNGQRFNGQRLVGAACITAEDVMDRGCLDLRASSQRVLTAED